MADVPPTPSAQATFQETVARAVSEHMSRVEKERRSMPENGGVYVSRPEFDLFKGELHDFKTETNEKLGGLSSELKSVGAEMRKLFGDFSNNQSAAKNDGFSKIGIVLSVVVSLGVAIVGGFIKIENDSIQDKIVSQGVALNDKLSAFATTAATASTATQKIVDAVALNQQKMSDNFVGRNELDFRIGGNSGRIDRLTMTQDAHNADISALKANIESLQKDVETLRQDSVKRDDIDGRSGDLSKRLDLISNRVEELQRTSASVSVLQETVHQMNADLSQVRDRLLGAPKYLVGPGQSQSGN